MSSDEQLDRLEALLAEINASDDFDEEDEPETDISPKPLSDPKEDEPIKNSTKQSAPEDESLKPKPEEEKNDVEKTPIDVVKNLTEQPKPKINEEINNESNTKAAASEKQKDSDAIKSSKESSDLAKSNSSEGSSELHVESEVKLTENALDKKPSHGFSEESTPSEEKLLSSKANSLDFKGGATKPVSQVVPKEKVISVDELTPKDKLELESTSSGTKPISESKATSSKSASEKNPVPEGKYAPENKTSQSSSESKPDTVDKSVLGDKSVSEDKIKSKPTPDSKHASDKLASENEPVPEDKPTIKDIPISEDKPVSNEPVSEKPVSEKPVSEKPVSEKPVSEPPVAKSEPISERKTIPEEKKVTASLESKTPEEKPVTTDPPNKNAANKKKQKKARQKMRAKAAKAGASPYLASDSPNLDLMSPDLATDSPDLTPDSPNLDSMALADKSTRAQASSTKVPSKDPAEVADAKDNSSKAEDLDAASGSTVQKKSPPTESRGKVEEKSSDSVEKSSALPHLETSAESDEHTPENGNETASQKDSAQLESSQETSSSVRRSQGAPDSLGIFISDAKDKHKSVSSGASSDLATSPSNAAEIPSEPTSSESLMFKVEESKTTDVPHVPSDEAASSKSLVEPGQLEGTKGQTLSEQIAPKSSDTTPAEDAKVEKSGSVSFSGEETKLSDDPVTEVESNGIVQAIIEPASKSPLEPVAKDTSSTSKPSSSTDSSVTGSEKQTAGQSTEEKGAQSGAHTFENFYSGLMGSLIPGVEEVEKFAYASSENPEAESETKPVKDDSSDKSTGEEVKEIKPTKEAVSTEDLASGADKSPQDQSDATSGSGADSKETEVTAESKAASQTEQKSEVKEFEKPDVAKPEAAKAETTGLKATKPEATEPEAIKPEKAKKETVAPPKKDESNVVYLYMSLASGVRGSMGRFNKATTILKSYDIDFVPIEITLDERAKRLWKLKGVPKNKVLPAVFRDGDMKCDFNELVEANEIEDVEDLIFDGL